ncbi:MAG: plasmid mobilization relaxosome protein MobC [Leptospirales bacterium]
MSFAIMPCESLFRIRELALLQSRAGGRPISAFLRESGLNVTERKSEALLPLILQIARVWNNLNQIARDLNSRHKTGSSIHLVEVAVRLRGIEKDLGNVLQDIRKGQGKGERH